MEPGKHPPATPRRTRVLSWALLVIPVLFFVFLEIGLRLLDVGGNYPLFVEVPGHPNFQMPNPEVGKRYFATTRGIPGPPHDAFLTEKPDSSIRIVVQGGSTTAGFPYRRGGSFPRMLEQRLSQSLPGRTVEVVNTGMDAVSSTVLRDLVGEVLEIEPDAVLIYAGHNEYYGALGVASRESTGSWLVRAYLALDQLRIVQGLRSLIVWTASADESLAPTATMMEELVRDREIVFDGPVYRHGIRQFQENLTDMLCRYRDAGVPVFVGTLASNERDMPPFATGLSPATDRSGWEELRQQSHEAVRDADSLAAGSLFDQLVAMDDVSALGYFNRARWLDISGLPERAAADYAAARDRDQLPFRAPSAMNAVIAESAAACDAELVDTRRAIATRSPRGIPGRSLFLEHLHPNVDGYFILADAFYRPIIEHTKRSTPATWVPAPLARREVLVTELDSALAYIHVRRLLNNWPFKIGSPVEEALEVTTSVDSLAVDVFRNTISWAQATAQLGSRNESAGRNREALRAALALVQERPYLAAPHAVAAALFARTGRLREALELYRTANALEPTADSRRMVGQMLLRTDRAQDAIAWLESAIAESPDHPGALYDAGVTYLALQRYAEAERMADRLLELDPDSPGASRLKARSQER